MRRRVLRKVVNADDGTEEWVEVAPEVAKVLDAPEPRLKERLLRRPESIEAMDEARARYWGGRGFPFEGLRLRFDWLIGESACWAGAESLWLWDSEREVWACRFCGHLDRLPAVAYCLGCDRSGKDKAIGCPSGVDIEKRRAGRGTVYAPADDGLKGGRE